MDRIQFKPIQVQKNKGLHNEWQVKAFELYEKLKLSHKDLPNLFRFFKFNYPKYPQHINNAYSFVSDYEGNTPKLKLFYWKYSQLKKAG